MGPGANMSGRVDWEKKLSDEELVEYVTLDKFINQDGWLERQPPTL